MLDSWKFVGKFVLLVGASGGQAHAQAPADTTVKAPLTIGAAVHGAFIVAHTPKVDHLTRTHPTGGEVHLEWQATGRKPWHAAWRYPKTGVAIAYYDFHNPILGHCVSVSPYATKYIYRSARQQVHFRLGVGLGYFTNPFSLRDNRKNTIVSTALNAAIHFRFEYAARLTEHLDAEAAISLQHYSNGATAKPNFGVNLPTASVGLSWHRARWVPAPAPRRLLPLPAGQRRWFVDVATSVGWRQWGVYDRQRYLVNGVHVQTGRRLNQKNNLTAGLDYFYDRSLLVQRVADTIDVDRVSPTVDVQKAGIVAGHELLLGQLAFDWHLGWYLYAPYRSATPYYARIGLKYFFTEHVFGCVDLKAHRGSADVVEWKVGVRI
ncbi:MAG: acyloxyacyl hydrolase [Hymenobacteraceae bacterium]|nr:acyloxyacyl hydrolase [Hymenobacteraceae bacterium]